MERESYSVGSNGNWSVFFEVDVTACQNVRYEYLLSKQFNSTLSGPLSQCYDYDVPTLFWEL